MAPIFVATWISLWNYGSSVIREVFWGGRKFIHKVDGVPGAIEGNFGELRPALTRQTVHDGETPRHESPRLS